MQGLKGGGNKERVIYCSIDGVELSIISLYNSITQDLEKRRIGIGVVERGALDINRRETPKR